MDRLIIESIEGRIMLGTTMFVAIMILTGWIAINEPARMAEFVEQHEGRAIERGAELFAANCATCHEVNGLGIGGRAPALNNPQMFGHDFLADINGEIARLQRQYLDINGVDDGLNVPPFNIRATEGTLSTLEARRTELESQIIEAEDEAEASDLFVQLLHVEALLSEDTEGVAARIAAIEADEPIGEDANPELSGTVTETDGVFEVTGDLGDRYQALQDNIPTTLVEIDDALNGEDGLLAQREARIEELSGAIQRGYYPRLDVVREEDVIATESGYTLWLTNYLMEDANRLTQIEFGGSLNGYLITTLIHGRPGSNDVWPAPMVSWSQRGGGPLRDDQIEDIVAYITNWDKGDNWAIADLNAVQQFGLIHQAYTGPVEGGVESVGTSPDASALPAGDAARGELLYTGQEPAETGVILGCVGCHLGGAVGPDSMGTWTRVETQRLVEDQFAGYTGEQYLAESIVAPSSYIVTPYADGLMPQTYGSDLSEQDMADIISYLMTQDQ